MNYIYSLPKYRENVIPVASEVAANKIGITSLKPKQVKAITSFNL